MGRWSAETASDNEFCHKTNSPNPLPNPDVTPETCLSALQTEQYMVRTQYDPQYITNIHPSKADCMGKLMSPHNNMNYQDYIERCSDLEEKHHINDKYLFPYTGNVFLFLIQIDESYARNQIKIFFEIRFLKV